MDYIRTKVYEFVKDFSERQKIFWLSTISFVESSFFPIPPDPFLMLAVINKPKNWLRYFWTVTIFSVLGGIFGYLIGAFFFDIIGAKIISFYSLEEAFDYLSELFNVYTFLAIFVSAFTPIPYKIFTLSAGFFGINVISFVAASVLGRSIRFFAVSWLMKVFGERFGRRIIKIVDLVLIILVLLLVTYSVISIFR